MGKIQRTAPHRSKLRTYHLTISTPLGLRRTILPRLNVISASNNYLLLEKNLLRDMEPTGAFDFKACLVIPKFQLGKEICNYLLRTCHFPGTVTAFHCEKRACFILRCTTRFLIKEMAFLRLNLPWMGQNSQFSKPQAFYPVKFMLNLSFSVMQIRNLKEEHNFQPSIMSAILPGKRISFPL